MQTATTSSYTINIDKKVINLKKLLQEYIANNYIVLIAKERAEQELWERKIQLPGYCRLCGAEHAEWIPFEGNVVVWKDCYFDIRILIFEFENNYGNKRN